jgi:hypothetical protein
MHVKGCKGLNGDVEMMMDMERSIAGRPQTDEELSEALKRHPVLKARVMNLLALVDGADVERADDAERQAIQELRGMGQQVLTDWAANQARRSASELNRAEADKDGKKKSTGTAPSAKSKQKSSVSGTSVKEG